MYASSKQWSIITYDLSTRYDSLHFNCDYVAYAKVKDTGIVVDD